MGELSGQSYHGLDRLAALNRQANVCIEKAETALREHSPVAAREWFAAAEAALDAAAAQRNQLDTGTPPAPTVDGGERHG